MCDLINLGLLICSEAGASDALYSVCVDQRMQEAPDLCDALCFGVALLALLFSDSDVLAVTRTSFMNPLQCCPFDLLQSFIDLFVTLSVQ